MQSVHAWVESSSAVWDGGSQFHIPPLVTLPPSGNTWAGTAGWHQELMSLSDIYLGRSGSVMTTPLPPSHIAPLGTLRLSVTFSLFLLSFCGRSWLLTLDWNKTLMGQYSYEVSFVFPEPHPCLGLAMYVQDYIVNASFFAKRFPTYFHWIIYAYSGFNSSIFSSRKPVLNSFPWALLCLHSIASRVSWLYSRITLNWNSLFLCLYISCMSS